MMALGMGNGAVFQLVPQHFRKEIGMVTGIVGAAGGIGGFFLPNILGSLKQVTGSYTTGFISFSCIALFAFVLVLAAGYYRRKSYGAESSPADV
ncbi:nitrate transporter [Bacillus amyloliquefaciens]|nr:nitrate transporter [Bacillus amyloliquefaciens]